MSRECEYCGSTVHNDERLNCPNCNGTLKAAIQPPVVDEEGWDYFAKGGDSHRRDRDIDTEALKWHLLMTYSAGLHDDSLSFYQRSSHRRSAWDRFWSYQPDDNVAGCVAVYGGVALGVALVIVALYLGVQLW